MQGGCEHEESPAHPDSACAVAVEAALAGGLREPKLMHVCVRARAQTRPLRVPLTPNSLVVPETLTQRTSLLASCLWDSIQSDHVVPCHYILYTWSH